ncbi:hypothetical protein HUG10_07565 [Halorarum halophilum]|uniref:Uncharacterized protein n=1 Tax=Halorarum halophilum TaxID=2743090 RepID=A0A7D5K7I8_9EURY|nr:hypothetical protein [Halobaculum halophilum]QLG27414.1 hypothetical protein HUG10_07565 [Halobaculum halophilum]
MNRRRLLVAVGPSTLLLSGCLTSPDENRVPDEAYDSETMVEFGWQEESPLAGGLTSHSESRYHVAVIGSASDSNVNRAFLRENDGDHLLAFLDETPFETERILALQARHSSGARYLDAESIRIDVGEQLEASIAIGTTEGGAAAENRETLFVRFEVNDENPRRARVVDHEQGGDVTVSSV